LIAYILYLEAYLQKPIQLLLHPNIQTPVHISVQVLVQVPEQLEQPLEQLLPQLMLQILLQLPPQALSQLPAQVDVHVLHVPTFSGSSIFMHEVNFDASATTPSMGSALLTALLKNERLLMISFLSKFAMPLLTHNEYLHYTKN
jgi:hypothetical protein